MKIEEIVGKRMRERREELGLSQSQLGKRIGGHLGRDWPRQAVSAAEAGQRSFGIADMVVLAHVLGISIGHLVTPPAGLPQVEMAPGVFAERDVVLHAVIPLMAADGPLNRQAEQAFTDLLLHVGQLGQAAGRLQGDMERMQRIAIAQQRGDTGS